MRLFTKVPIHEANFYYKLIFPVVHRLQSFLDFPLLPRIKIVLQIKSLNLLRHFRHRRRSRPQIAAPAYPSPSAAAATPSPSAAATSAHLQLTSIGATPSTAEATAVAEAAAQRSRIAARPLQLKRRLQRRSSRRSRSSNEKGRYPRSSTQKAAANLKSNGFLLDFENGILRIPFGLFWQCCNSIAIQDNQEGCLQADSTASQRISRHSAHGPLPSWLLQHLNW